MTSHLNIPNIISRKIPEKFRSLWIFFLFYVNGRFEQASSRTEQLRESSRINILLIIWLYLVYDIIVFSCNF